MLVLCRQENKYTWKIELKLVTETNSIHSIVIHSFKKYFLRPITRQMPCWG